MTNELHTPERCCDLVMKGGITSGIVYPPAICRIAEKFFLIGIGGTSAGAIAGCLAAAAEYRRRQDGSMAGFERLEQIPRELAAKGRLLSLFRPEASTRNLFNFFRKAQGLDDAGWWRRTWWKSRLLWRVFRHKKTLAPMIENGFGLCTGMAGGKGSDRDAPPLTAWLADTIDEIAGLDGRPLTFGDLRQAPVPAQLADTMRGNESRSIDLRVVTTCVTFGRPYLLPFRNDLFAFDPEEWRRLFPQRIVDHMMAKAETIGDSSRRRDGKLPLPAGDDLPVVVAARMSLSFPGLFTMVPLHAVDYNAPQLEDGSFPLRKVWFSDGGITSNLPIHCFDVLYPRWPTLALNLQYTDEKGEPARSVVDKESLVYLIQRRADGSRDLWHTFERDSAEKRGTGLPELVGFLLAIFRSAQVWHDNSLLLLPGYRDRVAEIWLRAKEGALNLEIPPPIFNALIARGNDAGIKLRDRFADTPQDETLSWDGHRWTRLRASLEGLAVALKGFEHSVRQPLPGDRSLQDLLAHPQAVPCYPFPSMAKLEEASRALDVLRQWIGDLAPEDSLADDEHPFADGPKPPLEIRGVAFM